MSKFRARPTDPEQTRANNIKLCTITFHEVVGPIGQGGVPIGSASRYHSPPSVPSPPRTPPGGPMAAVCFCPTNARRQRKQTTRSNRRQRNKANSAFFFRRIPTACRRESGRAREARAGPRRKPASGPPSASNQTPFAHPLESAAARLGNPADDDAARLGNPTDDDAG